MTNDLILYERFLGTDAVWRATATFGMAAGRWHRPIWTTPLVEYFITWSSLLINGQIYEFGGTESNLKHVHWSAFVDGIDCILFFVCSFCVS